MKFVLVDRREIVEDTMAFWFEPERPFPFQAGQFGDFMLSNPPETDGKGNARSFSFASSPDDPRVMIATRMRPSAFKNSLRQIPLETPLEVMGPMGSLVLHDDASVPAVFLTGGIGITPVRSIVQYATEQGLAHPLYVFYSNRTRASSAFLDDFREWEARNNNLHFIPTLTDQHPADWEGEFGVIDRAMIERHGPDIHRAIFYIVGPPGMVGAMRQLLSDIEPERVRTEDFSGY